MRLFAAIELSSAVKDEIRSIQSRLRDLGFHDLSYSNPEQSHLTLKFLGDVPQTSLQEIIDALEKAARIAKPFGMVVGNVGWFPPKKAPRVIWVAVIEKDAQGCMAALAQSCEEKLESVGYPRDDRPFSPHITVARVKQPPASKRLPSALDQIKVASVETLVTHLALFESTLKPAGAVHSLIHRVQL